MSIRTQSYLYQYFTINVNSDTTLSVPVLYYHCNSDTTLSVPKRYYQCQSRHHFICTSTLLSMSIQTPLYLYQWFTINVNSDTTLSVSMLYYQCQFGHHFICIKTLLSMSIRTQLYLYISQSFLSQSNFKITNTPLFSLDYKAI